MTSASYRQREFTSIRQHQSYQESRYKGGPQIGLSAVIESPRSPQSTYRVHTLTIESLLHDLHVIFGIFQIGGH